MGDRGFPDSFEAEQEQIAKRTNDLADVDLGLANNPIFEDDWCFDDTAIVSRTTVEEFFLKGISARTDFGEIQFPQFTDTVASESTAAIFGFQSEQNVGVPVDCLTHEMAERAPAGDAATGDISRADPDIGKLHAFAECGQIPGMVAEVGIHVLNEVIIMIDGPLKARQCRGTKSLFFGS